MIDLAVEQHEAEVYLLWGCGVVGELLEEVLALLQRRVHERNRVLFGGVVLYPQLGAPRVPGVVGRGLEVGLLGVGYARFAHAFTHLNKIIIIRPYRTIEYFIITLKSL